METPAIGKVKQNASLPTHTALSNDDGTVFEFDSLPLAYFATFAQFRVTVDLDATFSDHRLCHAPACADTRDFQQVIQLDKFMTFQVELFHCTILVISCPPDRGVPRQGAGGGLFAALSGDLPSICRKIRILHNSRFSSTRSLRPVADPRQLGRDCIAVVSLQLQRAVLYGPSGAQCRF
jgi:hypothetical protein